MKIRYKNTQLMNGLFLLEIFGPLQNHIKILLNFKPFSN